MTTQNIGLFQALGAKMAYLSQRQSVIAQNIANADTPKYKPHDLAPVDFDALLKEVAPQTGAARLMPATTSAGHMGGVNEIANPKNKAQKTTYETAPDGNAVIMEEQMVKSAKNTMDYNLITSLYEKNVGLIRIALGGR